MPVNRLDREVLENPCKRSKWPPFKMIARSKFKNGGHLNKKI